MKKIGILMVVVTLSLVGCQAAGPETYSSNAGSGTPAGSKGCSFEEITGKPYLIAPSFKRYITNSFFYDPERETVYQRDKSKFSSLVSQEFKIIETGVVTKEDIESRKPFLSKYRYRENDIKGTPYIRDKTFSSKLVTEDCSVYYLSGATPVKSLLSSVVNSDGSAIDEGDLLALYGSEPLKKKEMEAAIEYDRFEKRVKVKTPYYDDMLIRGSIDAKNESEPFVQLYLNLTFFKKWGFVSSAIDTDGVRHKVVKISTDSDCRHSDIAGCKLTEIVGVAISEDFLRDNRDGFELKVFGTKERVVKVSGQMVEGFLSGLEKARKRAESGDFGV